MVCVPVGSSSSTTSRGPADTSSRWDHVAGPFGRLRRRALLLRDCGAADGLMSGSRRLLELTGLPPVAGRHRSCRFAARVGEPRRIWVWPDGGVPRSPVTICLTSYTDRSVRSRTRGPEGTQYRRSQPRRDGPQRDGPDRAGGGGRGRRHGGGIAEVLAMAGLGGDRRRHRGHHPPQSGRGPVEAEEFEQRGLSTRARPSWSGRTSSRREPGRGGRRRRPDRGGRARASEIKGPCSRSIEARPAGRQSSAPTPRPSRSANWRADVEHGSVSSACTSPTRRRSSPGSS